MGPATAPPASTRLRLLGPVQLWAGDRPVDLGPARQRTVLAALAVDAGTPVPLDTLIGRVWDENPPAGVRSGLYSYLTRIRRALAHLQPGPGPHQRSGGYVLALDPDVVDLHRFRRLTEQARQHADDGARVDLLAEALDLWAGPALADLTGRWAAGVRTHLTQQRLDAVLAWAQAQLRLDRPDAVVAPLREQLTEHPLVEPLAARLMEALHRLGRGAEALALYAAVRERLVDELGAGPGADLRRVHEAILRDEPVQPAPVPSAPRSAVPRQLPMMPSGFAARQREIDALDALVRHVGERTTTVVVSALHGTAGVGKTTLALHWGHRAAGLFPDGQLYVNLRGFDPGGRAMDPSDALRWFLESLDVSGIPAEPEARAALFRSRLAGRRMLIVLDNARDVAQVRPLLPGVPGCLVLVTSRNQLTGLVAADGAVPVSLDLLTPDEARQLLAGRIGAERAASDPAALDEIIARCVGLPLALAVVAARAITRPRVSLAMLAAELLTVDSGLTALAGGDDEYTDLRAVFSWSYRALSPPAAELFRLFGLHPGPDVTVAALASMAARPAAEVGVLLTELTRANLVTEATPGRYGCHDLLRAYAAELARQHDGAATRRMLDHYLATGFAAAMLLDPLRKPIEVPPLALGVQPEAVAGLDEARAWFAVERTVLLGAVNRAVESRHDVHVWQLGWTLNHILDFGGHWQEYAAVAEAAVAAAERLGDEDAESRTLRNLGVAYINSDQYEQGENVLERALELTTRMGDDYAQAYVHRFMAAAVGQQERHAEAIEHARQSLALFDTAGNTRGVALALNAIGWHQAQLGEFTEALEPCERALEIFRGLDDPNNVAHTLDSVGYIRHHLGRYAEAVEDFREAAVLMRRLDNQRYEATTLVKLGETYRCLGDLDAARATWTEAVRTLADLGVPEAEDARAKLDALG